MDWSKIIAAAGTAIVGGLCTWGVPAIRRAARNWGKTEVDLADEQLELAIKYAEDAKRTPGVEDDKTANEIVARARKHRENAKRLAGLADSLASGDVPQP